MDDFSAEERRFLLQIGDTGMVTFNPLEDELIKFLIESGLVTAERVDDETAVLRLTVEGHTLVTRLRENMG
ncbi:MAG: hypothetical protein JWN07_3544 [Hyphomicrobiales bacterium]|nr:hypothetical protein [Hyphomicrobiales bacterium]